MARYRSPNDYFGFLLGDSSPSPTVATAPAVTAWPDAGSLPVDPFIPAPGTGGTGGTGTGGATQGGQGNIDGRVSRMQQRYPGFTYDPTMKWGPQVSAAMHARNAARTPGTEGAEAAGGLQPVSAPPTPQMPQLGNPQTVWGGGQPVSGAPGWGQRGGAAQWGRPAGQRRTPWG